MYSLLAKELRDELIAVCKKMSPAERLEAFVRHSQLVGEIYRAGIENRQSGKHRKFLTKSTDGS